MSSTRSSFTHVQHDSEVASKTGGCANLDDSLTYIKPPPKSLPADAKLLDEWLCDPENPRNWTTSRKWTSVAVVSLYLFVAPLANTLMAPGLSEIRARYEIESPTVLAMTVCIFYLPYGIGPLILGPLSEMYGRKWVLHIGNLCCMIFHLGCAFAPSTAVLIIFRFLVGLSGGAPYACGSAVIGDLFAERERAFALAMYHVVPVIGPMIGPIAGGFIAQTVGVQYCFFVLAGLTGLASLIGIPFLRETYAPLLKIRSGSHRPTDPEKVLRSREEINPPYRKLHYLWINFSRPLMLLSHSPVCLILSLYMAFINGIYLLLSTTFSGLFHNTYGFSTGITGLMYLGVGIGGLLAAACIGTFSTVVYNRLADKNGGVGEPEMRIPPMFFGAVCVPIGLFWFGWSAQAEMQWIMPVIGTGIFGFGLITTFLPIELYLIDSFNYAASALSAAFMFRSLLGFAFPLFGGQMFTALGFGGGSSLLGGVAILLGIFFPIYIYYRGATLRAKSDLNF
ncbi:multidrug resistance protein 4 [Mycena alexandri]|uniref:Multidrug resistance protein 4 n=1 Tax=Mycena alexandri TaxID=1745969 RepID=A0AAD6X1Z6_9AGAR|nr:multidrug resistance protein 4 [Mycena alexandri]